MSSQATLHPSPSIELHRLFSKPKIAIWEFFGVLFTNAVGGSLHFAFELSGYWTPVAFFAAVNESTWEHLKFYFWAGLLWSLIEYTYVKDVANNYWYGKALNLLITPIVISISFYAYLGVVLPRYGRGFFQMDIAVGVFGVIVGHLVSSYILQHPPLPKLRRRAAAVILTILLFMFSTFTFFPPKLFLFEDFWGYEYNGAYGILEDYEPYRVFVPADE